MTRAALARLERKPDDLVTAVEQAVSGMTWLQPTDGGLIALALRYAAQIESAVGTSEESKMVGWLGPHLVNTLKALGGTPEERRKLVGKDTPSGNLAKLRAARK